MLNAVAASRGMGSVTFKLSPAARHVDDHCTVAVQLRVSGPAQRAVTDSGYTKNRHVEREHRPNRARHVAGDL